MELVEHCGPALQQSAAIGSRLDALDAAIEEANAECMLELCNRSGNRRLGRRKKSGGLAHAAGLHHGHQNAQVVQADAALNAPDLVHGAVSHTVRDMTLSNNSTTRLRQEMDTVDPAPLLAGQPVQPMVGGASCQRA